MQKHVNLVDLVKSFPRNIFLQNLASIQKGTSPIKFAHLAEKSEKGSVSNLPSKVAAALGPGAGPLHAPARAGGGGGPAGEAAEVALAQGCLRSPSYMTPSSLSLLAAFQLFSYLLFFFHVLT